MSVYAAPYSVIALQCVPAMLWIAVGFAAFVFIAIKCGDAERGQNDFDL